MAEKGNLMIELDSEVHQAFLESSAVSRKYPIVLLFLTPFFIFLVQKGASANMLKIGTKRRRTQAQICLLYTSPSPRDVEESRMPSSA